jgi:hypothetical protein
VKWLIETVSPNISLKEDIISNGDVRTTPGLEKIGMDTGICSFAHVRPEIISNDVIGPKKIDRILVAAKGGPIIVPDPHIIINDV